MPKFSLIGDSELGSKETLVGESILSIPSKPKPVVSEWESSEGGVGVRGGAGIGAMAAMVVVLATNRYSWSLYGRIPCCWCLCSIITVTDVIPH